MRILFLSQLIPYPPDAGPKVRSYHVLQYLADAGHQVTLVAFRRTTDRPEQLAHLEQFCTAIHTVPIYRSRMMDAWHLLRSLVLAQPFLIARDWSPRMAQLLRQLGAGDEGRQGHFDIVHTDQLWMAPYGLLWRRAAPHGPRLILDQHNAVFQIPRRLAENEGSALKRLALRLEGRKLAAYESRVCNLFDQVAWVTEEDQAALSTHMSEAARAQLQAHSTVIPICVDPVQTPPLVRTSATQRVTFIGGLHWPPNAEGLLWLVREVWPMITRQVPNARLTIIGKNPPAQLTTPQFQTQHPEIEVTGYVDDPLPYLWETAVSVVPLHAGGGMRVKILEAWCWGLPIVSTTIGAEGLRYTHGQNLLIADTADCFAENVIYLLRQSDAAQALADNGRTTAETCYDWHKVYHTWEQVYAH
jgi:polysaccharide biosynthesis protein PslH